MISVAHALRDENAAGAFRSVESLLLGMDRERFSLSLLVPEGYPAPVLSGVSYHPLPSRLCKDPFALALLLRRLSPRILHTHGWAAMRLAGRLAGGIRLVSTKHCAADYPTRPRLYRALTDLTVATSHEVYSRLRQAGIPERELLFLENAPLPPSPLSPEGRRRLRKKWGVGDRFAVGLCGRLHPVKGHETLLRAAALLDSGFVFLLLGDGPLRPHLETLARRMGIAERVLFLGGCADPAPFYGALDAHVSCSLSETSSLTLREGLAAGLPTAATDLPPNRTLPLRRFPVGDGEALARILSELRGEGGRHPPYLPDRALFSGRMAEAYLALTQGDPSFFRTFQKGI